MAKYGQSGKNQAGLIYRPPHVQVYIASERLQAIIPSSVSGLRPGQGRKRQPVTQCENDVF
jgi:hypothetical protein